jgi:hypothetical protein
MHGLPPEFVDAVIEQMGYRRRRIPQVLFHGMLIARIPSPAPPLPVARAVHRPFLPPSPSLAGKRRQVDHVHSFPLRLQIVPPSRTICPRSNWKVDDGLIGSVLPPLCQIERLSIQGFCSFWSWDPAPLLRPRIGTFYNCRLYVCSVSVIPKAFLPSYSPMLPRRSRSSSSKTSPSMIVPKRTVPLLSLPARHGPGGPPRWTI